MADEGRRSLDARFGAARADPTRLELQHLKATVRARLFGGEGDTTRVGDFTIKRRLGRGGMGAVYEAIDPAGEVVALKTLRGFSPAMLYQLKHEFRALAGVVHPNLVGLHKLYVAAEQAYFSMEMVRGVDFIAHVRGDLGPGAFDRAADVRLRAALAQLIDGVVALHGAGKLHRDLKPSNVLVTADGRVVVLDFGLVREIGSISTVTSSNEIFVGTPAYMAPEIASGQELGEAGDWYAIGVMLHEALCGALPFAGGGFQVILDKCRQDPPDARSVATGVPDELAELALALLRREPEARPSVLEIRRAVGGRILVPGAASPSAPPSGLVGRDAELAALLACFTAARARGRPALAAVVGEPGMGTSAILQAFAEAVIRDHDGLALHGRCYPAESVPYRAIDPLIDGLTHALLALDEDALLTLLPDDLGPLVRLFPVLGRVPALAAAPARGPPATLQRRAFAGLRRLLAAIARERPLCLVIDDLQWGDDESAGLLAELVADADDPAPALTVVFGVATRDAERCAILRHLEASPATPAIRRLEVGPLGDEEAASLARSIVGARASDDAIATLVDDAGGSPLLVLELARQMHAAGAAIAGGPPGQLDRLIQARLRELSPTARRLVELIAAASQPIAPRIALEAAGLAGADRSLIAALRASHLVSIRLADGGEVLEIHDRLRDAVLGRLDADRRAFLHLRLAEALEAADADPARLSVHYREAGVRSEALRHTLRAADAARASGAPRRAASFYAIALGLGPTPSLRRTIHLRLAETLIDLGHGIEAADHTLAAALLAPAAEALALRRSAALTLLRFGAAERGIHTLRHVLAAIHAPWPHRGALGLVELAKERLHLRLRGLRYALRAPGPADAHLVAEIDTLATAREGLSTIDPVTAQIFQCRLLRRALELGDPARLGHALAAEAAFIAHIGGPERPRVRRLLAESAALIERGGDPHAREGWALCAGVVAFSSGRWRECLGHLATIEALGLRHDGSAYVATLRTALDLGARVYLGDLEALVGLHREALARADASGDLCAQITLRSGPQVIARLVEDAVGAARDDLARAARGSTDTFTVQQAWAVLGERAVDAYAGDPAAAWGRLAQAWPTYRRSFAFAGPYLRIMARFWRASAAIAAAAAGERPLLDVADRQIQQLAGERAPWAASLVDLLCGGALAARGDERAAAAAYGAAARGLQRLEMRAFASAAAWRQARIVGGDEGHARAQALESALAAQGVASPARFMAMLAPGVR